MIWLPKIGAIITEAKNAYSFPLLAIIENGMIALGFYLLIHVTIMKQTSLNPLKIIHACADFKMIFYNAKVYFGIETTRGLY